jgi:hypothetical protein
MKKKQQVITIIGLDGKFVAPNRKTNFKFEKLVEQDKKNKELDPEKEFKFVRLPQTPKRNETKSELSQFKKDLARKHGSKTGKLKKKHLRRENETV